MGTKLERKDVKVFASNPNHATQVSAFLTGKNETPDYTSDPNAIQNAYYPKGWFGDGENNLPQGTDMNGVMYAESYKNAYLYEMGIAEWSSTQEYFENSYCQVNGVLYLSLIDENLNNNPTTDDGTKWKEIALEPYTGENVGTGEGVYKQKTIDNKLQFKTLAVTGNGNISSSGDVVTIAIGGGGTGDVYWGAIDGTLSNQSDLQQALNLKQNLIGYTPEDVSNKVTTVRTSSVATDTAYASEKATRTAIDNAITSANNYTDNALTNLSTDAFVLYANSWTDVYTGTLSTTAPTGTGTNYTLNSISPNTYENIANFTYTTTQETKLNNTFTYEVLVPIRNTTIRNWSFEFTLTITNQDVNNGLPMTIFQKSVDLITNSYNELNFQFKQDLINISEIIYPIGSEISFKIKAMSIPESGELAPYNFDLLVYDQDNPIVISRNRGINKHYVTSYNTQTLGYDVDQEYFNSFMLEQLAPMTATSPLTISSNNISIGSASTSTSGALSSTDWNTFNGKQDTITASTPLSLSSNTLSIAKATTSASGYLSSADWNTFNNKVSANNSTINFKINGGQLGNNFTLNQSSGTTIDFGTGWANTALNNTFTGTNKLGNVTINAGNISRDDGAIYLSASGELRLISDTQVRIRCSATGAGASGNFRYYGKITAGKSGDENPVSTYPGSDIRLKKDIKETTINGIETINKINIKEFRYKTEDEKHYKHIGVIAQDIEEFTPEIKDVVLHGEDDEKDMLAVEYGMFTPYLIKAVQELNAKVEALEARVEELERGNKKELEK